MEDLGANPADRVFQDSAQVVHRVLADRLGLPGRLAQLAAELLGEPLEIAVGAGVAAAMRARPARPASPAAPVAPLLAAPVPPAALAPPVPLAALVPLVPLVAFGVAGVPARPGLVPRAPGLIALAAALVSLALSFVPCP